MGGAAPPRGEAIPDLAQAGKGRSSGRPPNGTGPKLDGRERKQRTKGVVGGDQKLEKEGGIGNKEEPAY